MSAEAQSLAIFALSITCLIVFLIINVKMIKRHVDKWNSNWTMFFIMSLGRFGRAQQEYWKSKGFSETDANVIIKYSTLCYSEIIVSVLAIFAAFIIVGQYR